jgi:radical SAM protein with 4Fe4S-binding SPASM domain
MKTFRETIANQSGTSGLEEFLSENITLDLDQHLLSAICDITTGCNLNCITCTQGAGAKRAFADLDLASALRLKLVPQVADFSFGCRHEPLLHPKLETFVEAVTGIANQASMRVCVSMLTSGTLVDGDTAVSLDSAGLDGIIFSIDSSKPDIYEKIRRPARWEELHARLLSFMGKGGGLAARSGINSLIMRSSYPYLAQTIEDLIAIGFQRFSFQQILTTIKHMSNEAIRPRSADLAEINSLQSKYSSAPWGATVSVPSMPSQPVAPGSLLPLFAMGQVWDEELLPLRTRTVCVLPWYKIRIDHRGYVFPCQMITNKNEAFGNILGQEFGQIVNSPKAITFRENLLRGIPPCKTCARCVFGPDPQG